MSNELKPCPFCGKPAKWEKNFLQSGIARCSDYHCIGAFTHLSRSATIREWNTRPVEDEMYRVLSGICFEKSARICDYAPENCKVCSINKALKKARGEE